MKITIHCSKCREPLTDKFSAESCGIAFGSFVLQMECLKCDLLMDVRVTVEDYDKDGNMNIDREMAEKIMGWFDPDPIQSNIWANEDRSICMRHCDWHPSTDISQALGDGKSPDTVVGKICNENPEWQFTLDYAFGKWSALFFESAVGYIAAFFIDHGSAEADTPAMAICLAAAKTTDHDKEG